MCCQSHTHTHPHTCAPLHTHGHPCTPTHVHSPCTHAPCTLEWLWKTARSRPLAIRKARISFFLLSKQGTFRNLSGSTVLAAVELYPTLVFQVG